MEHSQELAAQIRARIGELEDDLQAHQRALAALEAPLARNQPTTNGRQRRRAQTPQSDTSTAIAESPPAPTSASMTIKRRRRPVASAEAVFDALTQGSDQAAVIAREFGVSTAAVRKRLEQLEEAGRVGRSGQRRGTRWRTHAAN